MLYKNEKISTGIIGLDRLLFGGIQLQEKADKPVVIMVKGSNGTSKSLFSMQLLHGLSKSIYELQEKPAGRGEGEFDSPIYCDSGKDCDNLNDMLLDMVISKCVNFIIEDNVRDNNKWAGCAFSSAVFEVEAGDVVRKIKCSELDGYLSQEVVVYNNRTNALHLTQINRPGVVGCGDNASFIKGRRFETISEYCQKSEKKNGGTYTPINERKDLGEISKEFFEIRLLGQGDSSEVVFSEDKNVPCLAMNVDASQQKNVTQLIKYAKKKPLILIFTVNDGAESEGIDPDLLIELRCYENCKTDYMIHQLCIRKSNLQTTALGWHQYKKRDYGIEVYPSSHVLLQRRRHMPKALLRADADILTETFQQYLDKEGGRHEEEEIAAIYERYVGSLTERRRENLIRIYTTLRKDLYTSKILNRILMKRFSKDEKRLNEQGGKVTTIIGKANTYKRYLSLGSTFSASCRKEHTLNILLNQEFDDMRMRIVCPTWGFHNSSAKTKRPGSSDADIRNSDEENLQEKCLTCYDYIHFWDLRMGYITPDEFFYYLIKQINIFSGGGKKLKRIVIDDIQQIDYNFPLLKADKLFLTALISVCKDYDLDLLILCDKNSTLVNDLRSLADNIICTERKDKDSYIYIERYAGYTAPSHIFGGRVQKIEELFYCRGVDKNGGGSESRTFALDHSRMDSVYVPNMDHFWVTSDTNKIVNVLKK